MCFSFLLFQFRYIGSNVFNTFFSTLYDFDFDFTIRVGYNSLSIGLKTNKTQAASQKNMSQSAERKQLNQETQHNSLPVKFPKF